MRPQKLVLRAFGPYAEEQVIDFRDLDAHRQFLIHGPTGSGKSTVLDAICFALYGQASGDDRPSSSMRSHHAKLGTITEVVFDFAVGPESYRVSRFPEQQRLRKRGTGTTLLRSTATLWRRSTRAEDPKDDGEVVAHQWSKVTKAVEEVLGFRSDQFRQVVVLPQGQFRRLLTARSAERQAIMETLFQTEIYRRIEDLLKTDARGIADDLKSLRAQRQILLEQAGIESEDELDDLRTELQQSTLAIEAARAKAAIDADTQARLLAEGRAVSEILRQAQARRETLDALEAQSSKFEVQRTHLELARRAARVVSAFEMTAEAQRKAAEAAKQRDALESEAKTAQTTLDEANTALEAQRAGAPQREAARQALQGLENLRDKLGDLASSKRRHSLSEAALQSSEARLSAAKNHVSDAQTRCKALRETLSRADLQAAQRVQITTALERDTATLDTLDALATAQSRQNEAKEKLTEAQAHFDALQDTLQREVRELDLMEILWESGQAALMARALHDGESCPVCGSESHPAPARADGPLPHRDTIGDKRARVARSRLELDKLRTQAESLRLDAATIDSTVQTLEARLGDNSDTPEIIEARIAEARATLEAGAAMEALRDQTSQDLSAAETALAARTLALAAATRDRDAATAALARDAAIAQEREAQIPEGLRDRDALEAAIEGAASHLDMLDCALAESVRQAEAASESFGALQAALDAAQGACAQALEAASSTQSALNERLEEAGFADTIAFKAALLDDAALENLDAEIKDFDGRTLAARMEAERAETLAAGLEAPELAVLEAAALSAKAAFEQAIKDETAMADRLALVGERIETLSTIGDKSGSLDARYAVIGRLASIASGRNELRMTFQRFVLTALLDEVLECATRRLRVMTGGRFELHRASNPTDSRAAGGLELEVHDSYTGTPRNVVTLSGGESFLAALSLALGLADVVQSYAGGIHLETIFVDEGFGSLDAEAMDLALKALMELQEGGRLVGIISHVPEMKERIKARLEVTRGPRGSSACFHL